MYLSGDFSNFELFLEVTEEVFFKRMPITMYKIDITVMGNTKKHMAEISKM